MMDSNISAIFCAENPKQELLQSTTRRQFLKYCIVKLES